MTAAGTTTQAPAAGTRDLDSRRARRLRLRLLTLPEPPDAVIWAIEHSLTRELRPCPP